MTGHTEKHLYEDKSNPRWIRASPKADQEDTRHVHKQSHRQFKDGEEPQSDISTRTGATVKIHTSQGDDGLKPRYKVDRP